MVQIYDGHFEERGPIQLQKASMPLLSISNYTPQSATQLLSLRDIIYFTRVNLSSSPYGKFQGNFERAVTKSGLLSF